MKNYTFGNTCFDCTVIPARQTQHYAPDVRVDILPQFLSLNPDSALLPQLVAGLSVPEIVQGLRGADLASLLLRAASEKVFKSCRRPRPCRSIGLIFQELNVFAASPAWAVPLNPLRETFWSIWLNSFRTGEWPGEHTCKTRLATGLAGRQMTRMIPDRSGGLRPTADLAFVALLSSFCRMYGMLF